MSHRGGRGAHGRCASYRPTGPDGRPKKHVLDGPTKDGKDPRRTYVPGGKNESAEEKKKRREEERKREKEQEQERKEDRERMARNQRAGLDDDGEPRAKRPTGGADNYQEPFEFNNPATPTGATPEGGDEDMGGGEDEPNPFQEDPEDTPSAPEPGDRTGKNWGYGQYAPFSASAYTNYASKTNNTTERRHRQGELITYLRGAAAELIETPDDFTRLPMIVSQTAPTKWPQPYNGTLNELCKKCGFAPNNMVKIRHTTGYAKVRGQATPGGVTIDAGKYQGRRAVLPGQGYTSRAYNLLYSYKSLTVTMTKVVTKKGVQIGRIGGKPHHGAFLITTDWLTYNLYNIYNTQIDNRPGDIFDLIYFFNQATRGLEERGSPIQVSIEEGNAFAFASKAAYPSAGQRSLPLHDQAQRKESRPVPETSDRPRPQKVLCRRMGKCGPEHWQENRRSTLLVT